MDSREIQPIKATHNTALHKVPEDMFAIAILKTILTQEETVLAHTVLYPPQKERT